MPFEIMDYKGPIQQNNIAEYGMLQRLVLHYVQ